MMMYSIHNSQCPAYLSEIVDSVADTQQRDGLRSAATTDYASPRLRSKFGERAFSYSGPTAWNRLPANIRHQATKASFKTHLKTFLFSEFLARF